MKTTELRQKSVTELETELLALHREQFNLRMQKGMGQFRRNHLLKQAKRAVARIKTILSEKAGQTV